MRRVQLKISDFARVANVTRFQAAGLLEEVFIARPLGKKGGGTHRTFTPQELLVFVVAYEIERKHGIKRGALAAVGEQLRQALTGPRPVSREARLVICFHPPSAAYLEPEAPVEEGTIVRLGPLFERVDNYLGVSGPQRDTTPILPLRPVIATGRRGSRNR